MRLVRGKKDGERCKARGLEKRAIQGVDGAVEKDGSKWARAEVCERSEVGRRAAAHRPPGLPDPHSSEALRTTEAKKRQARMRDMISAGRC